MIITLLLCGIIFFSFLIVLDKIGGTRVRRTVFRSSSMLMFSIYRNSKAFAVVLLITLIFTFVAHEGPKLIVQGRLSSMVLPWIFPRLLNVVFVFLCFVCSAQLLALLRRAFGREEGLTSGLLWGVCIVSVSGISSWLFLKYVFTFTDLTSLQLDRIFTIIGLTAASSLFLVGIPMVLGNTYLTRKSIIDYLAEGKKPNPFWSNILRYEYVVVLNGDSSSGKYSNLISHSVFSSGYSKKGRLSIPLPSDWLTRFSVYTNLDDLGPLRDPYYKTTSDLDGEEVLASKVVRFGETLLSPLMQVRVFLLESLDLDVINPSDDRRAQPNQQIFPVKSVFLLLSKSTREEDIAWFKKILSWNNLVQGLILIAKEDVWKRFVADLEGLRFVKVIYVESTDQSYVTEIINREIVNQYQNKIKSRSSLDWRVDQEVVLRKLDRLGYYEERSEKLDGDTIKRIIDLKEDFKTKAGMFLEQQYEDVGTNLSLIPDIMSLIRLKPAKDLIRLLASTPDYGSRIYIIFNLLEMMVRYMGIVRLVSLPSEHPDRVNFPFSFTQKDDPRKDVIDYTDVVHYLSTFVNANHESSTENLTVSENKLLKLLRLGHGTNIDADVERLAVLFPFITRPDDESVIGLLHFTALLRNQVRGHGAVTNLLASVCCTPLMNYLARVCEVVHQLDSYLLFNELGASEIRIDSFSYDASPFIIFDKGQNDVFFLEGIIKKRFVYVGYASGTKYKPSVLERDCVQQH